RASIDPRARRRGDRMMTGPTRRTLLIAGGAAALAGPGNAQQADSPRRIGFLWSSAAGSEDVLAPLQIRAFVEALRGLGWAEGRNITILQRISTEGRRESLRENARELV